MLLLPNELILLICPHTSNQGLWALTQVSSRIRSITILPFLDRHDISKSDIESGIITLKSQSFFVILAVAHLHQIQKLIVVNWYDYRRGVTVRQAVWTLGAILSATEIIPEIFIETNPYFHRNINILDLLARIPQTATRTLILITDDSVHISAPRKTPPIHWESMPPVCSSLKDFPTPVAVINYLVAGIPFLFIIFIVSAARNCGVALAWIYRRLFGPAWDREARLKNDLGRHASYGLSYRIQTTGTAFTFMTVPSSTPSGAQTFRPASGLGADVISALVSTIDLNPLNSARMESKANIRHSDLLLFLRHHPELKTLGLRLDSIRPSSLAIPDASAITSGIVSLSAPALYIPHLIPLTPLLTSISIEFHATRTHFASQRVALSDQEYRRALDGVASLPGTHALSLSLSFPGDAANLPWLWMPDDDAGAPEVRLHRVTDLLLSGNLTSNVAVGFSKASLRALPRWLRLFPGLNKVLIFPGFRQAEWEHRELLETISVQCQGVSVAFFSP
ncbi:hypothetical protein K438DRAFT_1867239 [Mycena galopus ATCC 62051]|nr:hypothetical protein K438DRAFT_1867239 [Mycena galopus ATCC 62051]